MKVFLLYPCGKKIEIRMPIYIYDNNIRSTILPGDAEYIKYAKKKFEINNIKVIEEEVIEKEIKKDLDFISVYNKKRSVE